VLVVLVVLSLAMNAYLFVRTNDLQSSTNATYESQAADIGQLLVRLGNLEATLGDVRADLSQAADEIDALQTADEQTAAELNLIRLDISQAQASLAALSASLAANASRLSTLGQDVANLEADVAGIETRLALLEVDVATLETTVASLATTVAGLGTRLTSLEARVDQLETLRSLVVRVSFLSFTQDVEPLSGNDWLIDVGISGACEAQGRTGHSRFVVPAYLDLSLNRIACSGAAVSIRIYAYWHLDDALIDIDPNPGNGRCGVLSPTDPAGCFFILSYTIGATVTGSADGNADGYVLDAYDGVLQYRVETLP
jgi:hypothetical protein